MLTIPTEGCCAGHPCDNCPTCQKGRCCRRDNPDYRLPELGEWDGPIYGELGVLNDDGEKVECHCCGEWYASVCVHAWHSHDLTADEYKSIFGLPLSRGAVTPAQRSKLRAANEPHLSLVREKAHALSPVSTFTVEQRVAYASRGRSPGSRFQSGVPPQTVGTSRYVGVSLKRGERRWRASIGKHIHLGYFDTEEEAARAYDTKARELYGDAARLNFPDDQAE